MMKEIVKSMPAECKRTAVIGAISTTASITSLFLEGAAKKIALGIGITTWIATVASSIDANNKITASMKEQTEKIVADWEAYKATHPEIFGNN